MAIESVSKEAANLGTWIGTAVTAITAYLCVDKFRRGGPIKEMGERMDRIEGNVNEKFQQLTNQRILDVSNLKSELSSHSVELAKVTTALEAQTKAFDNLVKRFDARDK